MPCTVASTSTRRVFDFSSGRGRYLGHTASEGWWAVRTSTFLALVALPALFCGTSRAQSDGVVQSWEVRYNGTGNGADQASAIEVDGAGNVYVTGCSIGNGSTLDIATVKYSSSGSQLWAVRYNGPGNGDDRAADIAVDEAGNVYVTGYITCPGTGEDYATIKYDASGNLQWIVGYNGPGNGSDRAAAVDVDGAGNVFVTGRSWGGWGTGIDYATVAYGPSGSQLWISRYGSENQTDEACAIATDPSGGIRVAGSSTWYSYGGIPATIDYVTIRYGADGSTLWVARHNGSAGMADEANDMAFSPAGQVVVTGGSHCLSGSGETLDFSTIAYDDNGDTQWLATYNGPVGTATDEAFAVAVSAAGATCVAGASIGEFWNYDYATVMYGPGGVQQWVARYNGPGNSVDEARDVAMDGAGNACITGMSTGSGTSSDYATLMYSSAGALQWSIRYDGPEHAEDRAVAIALDGAGNVYVTGYSPGTGTGDDYTTIKYVQTTGVEEEEGTPTLALGVISNPARAGLPVSLAVSAPGVSECRVEAISVDGRLVACLHDGPAPSDGMLVWDAGRVPAGVYIIRATSGSMESTARLVLLR